MGRIEPARTYRGRRSIGAAASIVRGPSIDVPVQKSYHLACGRYTRRVLTPGSVTGLTSIAGPNMNSSPTAAARVSVRKFITRARIGVYAWPVVIHASE